VADPQLADLAATRFSSIALTADPSQACMVLGECASLLGVESAAFATFLEDDPWHQSYRFLLACHPAWCAEYQRIGWFADDPWLNYARTNTMPACSSQIPVRTERQQDIVDLAKRFGVEAALIVPVPAFGQISRLGVLMLGSAQADFFQSPHFAKYKVLARALAMELHDWYIASIRSEVLAAARLNEVDIEMLRCERAGISTKGIARQMAMTSSAVDSRFQRIIARLGVPNRQTAARKAAEYGLI
jgi:DNA-binding CsgD family transcriptional regulator